MSMNREYLMLAHVYDQVKNRIAGWYVSKKLDGQRCLWDGGVSTGLPKRQIPWANNNKDSRYKEPPIATGLWSRYGNVIHAPEWFINSLPKGVMLDGELYMGYGMFEKTRSIVSTLEPGPGWKDITYNIFDMPSPAPFFQHGKINNNQCKMYMVENDCVSFYNERLEAFRRNCLVPTDLPDQRYLVNFRQSIGRMKQLMSIRPKDAPWRALAQVELPSVETAAVERLYKFLDDEVAKGGEGLVVRGPGSLWIPKRNQAMLKVKPFDDDEALIVGFVTGQGKLRGAIGAVVILWKNEATGITHEFQLSGFTDEERQLDSDEATIHAYNNPGELLHGDYQGKYFKRNTKIRFKYRGFTVDGVPREARYFR